jgi:hypothetical protein
MVIEKTGAVADPRDRGFATSRFDTPPRGCRILLGRKMFREKLSLRLDFFGLPPAAADAQTSLGKAS